MKMVNGNIKRGLKIAMWNCRRGLVDSENQPTHKYTEILNFIQTKSPHLLCIIESDLHSIQSRVTKQKYLTTNEIYENLKIDKYDIYLPASWSHFGQARLF